ncbi:MAG: TonB-dependent receptor family protein [Saprospiraceae bacterium]|nr:TonB-dependent receptor family protein [Saprospiraceae bacterium]
MNKANYFYRAVRAGLDYYVSEKTTLGLTTRIWGRDGDEAATNRTTVANTSLPDKVLYAFFTDNVGDDKTRGLYSSLNFKHEFDKKLGKTFTLDLDHSNINSTNINNLTIYPEDIPTQRSLSQQIVTQPIGLYVIKSDYTHPIDSTFKLSLGLKSSIATIDNGLSFTRAGIISPNESNDFLYKENINAAYINVNKTIGKFDLSAGLRTEQTVINGKTDEVTVLSRNYTQFFPSGSAVFRLNDHMAIQSSYTKRVNRPNFNQQNPFTYFIDSLTYTRGNPTLKPEIANVSKLTFTYDNQPVLALVIV